MRISKTLPEVGRHPLHVLPKGQTFLTLFARLSGTVLWRYHRKGDMSQNEVTVILDGKRGGQVERKLSPNVVVYVPSGEEFRPSKHGSGSGVRGSWK